MTKTEQVLLTLLHRQWVETRDPKDGDRFAALIAALTARDAKERFPSFVAAQMTPVEDLIAGWDAT